MDGLTGHMTKRVFYDGGGRFHIGI